MQALAGADDGVSSPVRADGIRRELQISRAASYTKINHAFTKPKVPSWGVVGLIAEVLAAQARPRGDPEAARMKTWKILRDCRLRGDGVHHSTRGIARLHNVNLAG
jgi:hypothetical protein